MEDIDLAVKAAWDAADSWNNSSATERSNILLKIADRMEENLDALARAETWDNGKSIRETRAADLPLAIDHFRYFAGVIRAEEGTVSELDNNTLSMNVLEPLGVVAQIIPWNFPLLMAAWKIAPALACGNPVVIKPAETPPLTLLRLAEIFHEVGLPKGVVNVVTGDGATGAALAEHEGIDKLAFTGSTAVGKKLAHVAAQRNIPITLELGGKSPNIIFEDGAIDQAIEGVIRGIYFNQGHVCCAGSRLFVQESIHDEVVRRLEHRMKSLRVGDPMDKNTDVGAINSREQLERIEAYLGKADTEGAKRHACSATGAPEGKGFWCEPTFFTGVQEAHTLAREEVFGPVLAVMTFRTPEEALTRANNTPYGLSGGVWTDKGSKIFKVTSAINAGILWANTFNKFDPGSPFGGVKESGVGREGGLQGLKEYCVLN